MNEVFISIDILEFMMNGMLKKMQALVFHLKKNLESQSFIVKQSQIMKIFQFKKKQFKHLMIKLPEDLYIHVFELECQINCMVLIIIK